MPSAQTIIGRIWVIGTTLLIAFIAYSVQIFVIYPWYGGEISIDLIKLLGPFNILIAMLFWNYFMTIRTGPGSVPKGWKPEGDEFEAKKLTGQPRYCRTCEAYKPPRTHHCRQCKRCIPRMGEIIIVLGLTIALDTTITLILYAFYFTSMSLVYTISVCCQCGYLGSIAMLMLNHGAYHFYCLFTNTTTIEAWEKDKVATLIRRGKIREVKFPYDLGWKENFYSVFGKSPLYWLVPTKVTTDCLKFKLADGEDEIEPGVWPPEDPYSYDNPSQQQLDLNSSPWTYGDGINPDLQPSNMFKRSQTGRSKVPPYHPDYNQADHEHSRISSAPSPIEYDNENLWRGPRIRRGSEGWEVGAIDREELLRKYIASNIASRTEEPGRYRRYVPESNSEDDSQSLASMSDS